MYVFAILSALVTLAAAFSLISYKVLRLPTTIGVMLLSLATSTLLVISGHAIPSLHARAVAIVGHIDFSALVRQDQFHSFDQVRAKSCLFRGRLL